MKTYQQQFTLQPCDFDSHGNLLPEKMLSIFQTLANKHAEILDVGFDRMIAKNLLWVITQIKYQVCLPAVPGTITGITWPLPANRIGFERDYMLCTQTGEVLVRASSNWVLIDSVERHLAPTHDVYPLSEYNEVRCFDKRVRRLRDFDAQGEGLRIVPQQSDFDCNGHVNNTKYARFASDALGDLGGVVDTLQIDYVNEVLPDEEIYLFTCRTAQEAQVKGIDCSGRRMFACSVGLAAQ